MNQNRNKTITDETGNVYGKLTVLSISHRHKSSGALFWHCRCSCGNTVNVLGYSLRKGLTKSCGCYIKFDRYSQLNVESLYKRYYNSVNQGAISRDLSMTISFDFFKQTVLLPCHYCGLPPYDKKYQYNRKRRLGGKGADFFLIFNGIDRVDSTLGYTEINSVSCCIMCNRMKSDFAESDFLNKIKEIYENRINEKTCNT